MNLLLLSSSRAGNTGYLEHAKDMLKQHLGNSIANILFIPFAGISIGFDAYEKKVTQIFSDIGYSVKSIHRHSSPTQAIEEAQAIVVGGGNTFCLLNSLYKHDILDPLRTKISQGMPYVGWSAGSNIVAPNICTTNDMPIIEPPSFKALSLLPFQINPHYIDGNPPGHNGETREQRIDEFLKVNPTQTVIGLPEGSALKLTHKNLKYLGERDAYQFTAGHGKKAIVPLTDLSYLL